jgi:hypothetical protein
MLQEEQINVFVSKCEPQVTGKILTRPISLVEDDPILFCPSASVYVLVRDGAWSSYRRFYPQFPDKSGPPSQSSTIGNRLLLKDADGSIVYLHIENPLSYVEKYIKNE